LAAALCEVAVATAVLLAAEVVVSVLPLLLVLAGVAGPNW
jgi:hypothetical protein